MHHLVVIAAATRRSFANPWSIARASSRGLAVSCNRLLFSRCSFSRLPRGLDGAKVLYRGTIGVYYIVLVPQFPSKARKSCLGTIYVVQPRSSCRRATHKTHAAANCENRFFALYRSHPRGLRLRRVVWQPPVTPALYGRKKNNLRASGWPKTTKHHQL